MVAISFTVLVAGCNAKDRHLASVVKDEQGRPFIVVREYVDSYATWEPTKLKEGYCNVWADCTTVKARRRDSMATTQSNPTYSQPGQ